MVAVCLCSFRFPLRLKCAGPRGCNKQRALGMSRDEFYPVRSGRDRFDTREKWQKRYSGGSGWYERVISGGKLE